ncbi:MAG: fumarate hydratase [Dehalococcoidaceae bacterium]|nr:fumarate hydratase [Dehalococcoidaceae bacterium]
MREIDISRISEVVARLCMTANFNLGRDVIDALKTAVEKEESPLGRQILSALLENAVIAGRDRLPLCQDCGTALVFVELGQDVHIVGGSLGDAIVEGVRQGYGQGYLRKSMVSRPYSDRKNSGDNTPPVIHYDMVPGDTVKIALMPKGGGAENASRLAMLKPGDGETAITDLVLQVVREAGGTACPPLVIGLGIGGTLERAAVMAKKALMRSVDSASQDDEIAGMERRILEQVNKLGIGPLGMGGSITALAVHAFAMPCHIASLPVAVNLQCHSARHAEAVI